MIARAKRMGYPVKTHHEADALSVWYCALMMNDRVQRTSYLTHHLSPLFWQEEDGLIL